MQRRVTQPIAFVHGASSIFKKNTFTSFVCKKALAVNTRTCNSYSKINVVATEDTTSYVNASDTEAVDGIQFMKADENAVTMEKKPDNGIVTEDPNPLRIVFPVEQTQAAIGDQVTGTTDLLRIGTVGVIIAVIAALLQHSWVAHHKNLAMEIIFVLGYLGITLEEILSYDKTGVALLMGVGVWTVLTTAAGDGAEGQHVTVLLSEQLGDISQILFFLVGAMTIVEIVDAHRGFKVVTDFITTNKRRVLMWTVGILTFFVSAILDNLTSTIVVVSLLKKLVDNPKERWLYGAVAVVAANAGGAWTPIGGKCV